MSKYASLPDLDPSQDVYETPDLADDVSTLPTTIGARTTSPAFSDDDRDNTPYRAIAPQLVGHYRHHSSATAAAIAESIDRTRIQPTNARSRFENAEVDASHVDFSDRVGAKRGHGYIASSRKGRRRRRAARKARRESESGVFSGEGEIGGSEDEDLEDSEDEEEETLEGRLARLRREVEELKVQVGEREEREERAKKEAKEAKAAAGEGEEEQKDVVAAPEEEESEVEVDEGEGMDGKRLRTGITDLSEVLETLQASSIKPTTALKHRTSGRAEANLARKIVSSLGTVAATQEPTDGPQELPTTALPPLQPSYTITYAPTFHTTHALATAADFDLRLAAIEKILGTTHSSTSHLSNLDKHLPANAILPTLDDLARQISVLSSTNQLFVEALNRRVKGLTDDAQKLVEARRAAARAAMLEGSASGGGGGGGGGGAGAGGGGGGGGGGLTRRATVSASALGGNPSSGADDDNTPLGGGGGGHTYTPGLTHHDTNDRETKLNALYGVLPTIQQLGPLLPSVLDRLRSLRAIHADAGRAVEGLEGIEKRQEEMQGEIERWREALEKVEGVVGRTEGVFLGNVGRVEEWVGGLEGRMERVEGLLRGGGGAFGEGGRE